MGAAEHGTARISAAAGAAGFALRVHAQAQQLCRLVQREPESLGRRINVAGKLGWVHSCHVEQNFVGVPHGLWIKFRVAAPSTPFR